MSRIRTVMGTLLLGLLGAGCGSDSSEPDPTHDLVFQGHLTSTPELLLLDATTDQVRRVFPEGVVVMEPAPSPDGTKVAFVVEDVTESTGDIFVAGRDGTGLTQLTFEEELDDQPAWSPDGRKIAFRSYRTDRAGDIWVMDANGSNPVNLTPDPLPGVTDEGHPAWSPDGTRIAYVGNAGGNYDIWTMDTDGSDPVQVTQTIDLDTEPAWSPDGSLIAFRRSSNVIGSDICVVAPGDTARRILLSGVQRMPAWSPDGERIVFVSHAHSLDRPDLYSFRPDGSGLEPIVTSAAQGGSLNPAFLKRL